MSAPLPGASVLRRLAVEAECDPRTIVKAFAGAEPRNLASHRAKKIVDEWLSSNGNARVDGAKAAK
jgi:hypothetical protein